MDYAARLQDLMYDLEHAESQMDYYQEKVSMYDSEIKILREQMANNDVEFDGEPE